MSSACTTRNAPSGAIRPVQFLGAKSRSLPVLLKVLGDELQAGSTVADVFSGSSLVAQGIARNGHRVAAYDALEHCAHFARALLGVGRDDAKDLPALELGSGDRQEAIWGPWLKREGRAIEAGSGDDLVEIARSLPQIWRPEGASTELAESFSRFVPGTRPGGGLAAAHYAGTYFGLAQAVEIDLIRTAIAAAVERGEVDRWQESLLITALLSAASECAFSAGKHYAQPHRIREGKDLAFIRSRIVEDRRKDIGRLFADRLETFFLSALTGAGNTAEARTLEELVAGATTLDVDAIYADPPYTAQQYSRFYHVPEILSLYQVPNLQRVKDEVTRGLYPVPDERHHSRFCSRREAPAAFEDLCRLAVDREAVLCVSYSFTRNGDTGNPRTIDFPHLLEIVRSHFSQVDEHEVDLTYRQFNATEIAGRADAEVLLVAKNA